MSEEQVTIPPVSTENKKEYIQQAVDFSRRQIWPGVKSFGNSLIDSGLSLLLLPWGIRNVVNRDSRIQHDFANQTEPRIARKTGAIAGGLAALALVGFVGYKAFEKRNEYSEPNAIYSELLLAPAILSAGYELGRRNRKP